MTAVTGNFKVKFDNPTDNLILKNDVSAGGRIEVLGDVNLTATSADGSILVYDKGNNTYVRRDIIQFNSGVGTWTINGGEF
jgi:hypothetical protein